MKRSVVIATCVLGILAAATVSAARQKSLTIALKWAPNPEGDQQRPNVEALVTGTAMIRIMPLVDKRDKGTQIGVNSEGASPVPVYSDSDIAGFVGESVKTYLHDSGVPIVETTPERVLRGQLDELWVKESENYHALVRVKYTLSDARGKTLWSGLVSGVCDHGGRALNPENYNETVSNAVLDLIANLVKDSSFRQAIRKR
jgi:hypothetical protein